MNEAPTNPLVYLFAAFLVIWVVFFIYAIFMARRQSMLRSDIEALKKELAERDRKAQTLKEWLASPNADRLRC